MMDTENLNDNLLLKACTTGNIEAFGVLVERYQPYVCTLTFSAVGNVEASEEIAQQAFVLAWQNIAQLRDFQKFKSWLSTITRHQITKHFQQHKRDATAKAASQEHPPPMTRSQVGPVDQAIAKEEQELVKRILAQIPEKYREPLILYYREGKSVKQVAQTFEITEANAKKRLSRARAMMRDQFENILERTLTRGSTAKQFSMAVVGLISVGGLAKTTAAAVGTTQVANTGNAWLSTLASSLTAKIIAAAAVVTLTLGTGAMLITPDIPPHPLEGVLQTLPPHLSEGLVLYFSFDTPLDPNQPNHIPDQSPAGNHGILQGGRFPKAFLGRALRCRQATETDGIIVKDHDSLDLQAVTIAAWIKTDHEDAQWNRILDKDWMRSYNLCIGGNTPNGTQRQRISCLECARRSVLSNTPVTDGRWHHIVGTYDGKCIKLYIDGHFDAQRAFNRPNPMIPNKTDIHIGQLAVHEPPPYDKANFEGLIDELRLYNRVLSDEEVSQLFRYRPVIE